MVKNKQFVIYEEPYFGRKFTRKQLKMAYKKDIDRSEFSSFDGWFHDNLRAGNIIVLRKNIHVK